MSHDNLEDEGRLEPRTVKLSIPLWQLVHLQSLKILTDRPISDLVSEALEAYFGRFQPFPFSGGGSDHSAARSSP